MKMSDENILNPDDFVMLLSVGGSPEPLIESIRHYKPKYVIFIASRDSNAKVLEILQATDSITLHEIITLSDYQNLLDCVRDIREELPKKLHLMKLPPDILLLADITGGTKVMSAALTLVMMEFRSRFTYVGGSRRTKDGLGTVESGHEKVIQMDNPWDAMGYREAREMVNSFNSGQFAAAREQAAFLKSRDSEYSAFYDGLDMIIEAFRNWDIFNYKTAKNLFDQGLRRLRLYDNRRHRNFSELYAKLRESFAILEAAEKEASLLHGEFRKLPADFGAIYLADLLANAARRAYHGHYDDAVARLYSAIEKTAKIALAKKGLNNSSLPKDTLTSCESLATKYGNEKSDIKLPLTDSFTLFCSLEQEHPMAQAYRQHETELAKTLQSRNLSLLAHGYKPVKEEDYRKLFTVALKFLNIPEDKLPSFPEMEINAIIF